MSSESLQQDQQTVVFGLGNEQFGVNIFRVNEIIRLPEITGIPKTDPHLMGLVNLRGENIPVIDLKARLGMGEIEETDLARIIVVESDQGHMGILVDQVREVISLTAGQVEKTPGLVTDEADDLIVGVARYEGQLISLLDLDGVLAA